MWGIWFLVVSAVTVLPRSLDSGPRDVRALQAPGDGERHGWEGQCFFYDRHCDRGGHWKHLGIPWSCQASGEPPRSLPHPHLTGETAPSAAGAPDNFYLFWCYKQLGLSLHVVIYLNTSIWAAWWTYSALSKEPSLYWFLFLALRTF